MLMQIQAIAVPHCISCLGLSVCIQPAPVDDGPARGRRRGGGDARVRDGGPGQPVAVDDAYMMSTNFFAFFNPESCNLLHLLHCHASLL